MLTFEKNNIKYTASINDENINYGDSTNETLSADVCFHNIAEHRDPIKHKNYNFIVMVVPFTKNSEEIRSQSKPYRNLYGVDKTFIMDVDETYPVHKKMKITHNKVVPTIELAKQYLINQGYKILEETDGA